MSQLTLIQGGEFIVCEDVAYVPPAAGAPPSLHATSALPINTMHTVSVRLDNDILPLPFVRSRERRAVTRKIRVDGPDATRIAAWLGLLPKATPTAP